jgi:hypothetical protein
MDALRIRFLDIYDFLTSRKIVKNAVDFAQKIEVSTSMITELKKGRIRVGIKVLQNTVSVFSMLNPEWLLIGKGEMLRLPPSSSREAAIAAAAAEQDTYKKKYYELLEQFTATNAKYAKLLEEQHDKDVTLLLVERKKIMQQSEADNS